jgi:hypothetical protein
MKSVTSICAVAAFSLFHIQSAEAATYSRSQCLHFVKQMKAWKTGKPLANSDNEATVRFKLNFCLMEGTLKPADVGNLLD